MNKDPKLFVWTKSADDILEMLAEVADEPLEAMGDTDAIARLCRAVAVTLMAASQRPTQKAMGQGAVRSQVESSDMRPRTQRCQLILGQGMLHACWDARNLNAPGKFPVSAPEHRYLTASEKRRPPFHGRTGRS
jgi:hypothetical protein